MTPRSFVGSRQVLILGSSKTLITTHETIWCHNPTITVIFAAATPQMSRSKTQ
jgi:hypothetical protein